MFKLAIVVVFLFLGIFKNYTVYSTTLCGFVVQSKRAEATAFVLHTGLVCLIACESLLQSY